MVKLHELLGAAPVAHFACMYTKHKTQKRKTWHDGFMSLYASRRLVLYDEGPLAGTLLEDAKIGVDLWDRRDEDHISVPKFLVEILDPTPLQVDGSASASASAPTPTPPSYSTGRPPEAAPRQNQAVTNGRRGNNLGPPATNSKFRTPATRPGPARLSKSSAPRERPHPYAAVASRSAPPSARNVAARFDFERHPTSEWDYKPNAVARTPDQVLALLDQQ